ncbi:serine hydrolase domain-containing protein [Parerythrobacter aestuarii]|uniref:serine hydrolase domain-containing protein n=1 Tax=Parerythrobacter aestuarii TaxID=3020909 RepID=UPI0024DE20BD|nr:serine hydrolase [Parerythrobacter aestuarii]
MKQPTLAAAVAALAFASPAAAQSQQEQLDARYDRALAAGYKALFLCSAIANAEANGVTRSVESVERWELTGIQAPLDTIVPTLEYRVMRAQNGEGVLSYVEVDWADNMQPRLAWHKEEGGCSLGPIGMAVPPEREKLPRSYPDAIVNDHDRIITGKRAEVFDAAFDGSYGKGSRTTAVIVSGQSGDGMWRYAGDFGPATPQRTWSVAKSIAATLVGVAVQRGDADVTMAADLEVGPTDPRTDITIDHMLRMASGRYSDTPGNRTDALYFGGSTVAETAAHWPIVHAPATVYRYANNDTLMAVRSIDHVFASYAPADFFRQVRMGNTVAEMDWRGDYVLSSQVWSTAPDLMRFGQLYLNDGKLPDGTRILPEGWVKYVSTPSGPQPNGPLGYGAGFWLFNKSEGVPPDTFAAMGNRGQYVVIVPSRNVVIVRRGEDPVGSRFDIVSFTRDVLAALED